MSIRYSSLPARTRAMFDNKLAAKNLSVTDFNRPAVDDAVRRAASEGGDKDKLSASEAGSAAAYLRDAWDDAWSAYAMVTAG